MEQLPWKPFTSAEALESYSSRPRPPEDYQRIIKAGVDAPSAGNEQPWHFMIIDRKKTLEEIPRRSTPTPEMLTQVPVAILICGDLSLEKHEGYWVQDCAAARKTCLLAASSEGLGSVWLGVYPRQDRVEGLRNLLNIPEHVVPFALLPVGYPAEKSP